MKLEQIKSVISDLTPRERTELNARLQEWLDDASDRRHQRVDCGYFQVVE